MRRGASIDSVKAGPRDHRRHCRLADHYSRVEFADLAHQIAGAFIEHFLQVRYV